MKFEYVGFRPIVSQHGISFKQGKDDKFVYFPYVYEIIDALNNNYEANKNYSYSIKLDNATINKLYEKVKIYFPNIEQEIKDKLNNYKKHLENEYEEIKEHSTLNSTDKSIYLTNLELMREYRTKRAKNKIFYYYAVASIAEIIKENRIKEIDIPFNEKFWHVLKTLQGILSSEKISSDIKTQYKNSTLLLKFKTSLY